MAPEPSVDSAGDSSELGVRGHIQVAALYVVPGIIAYTSAVIGHILWMPIWRQYVKQPDTTVGDPPLQQVLAGAGDAFAIVGFCAGLLAGAAIVIYGLGRFTDEQWRIRTKDGPRHSVVRSIPPKSGWPGCHLGNHRGGGSLMAAKVTTTIHDRDACPHCGGPVGSITTTGPGEHAIGPCGCRVGSQRLTEVFSA